MGWIFSRDSLTLPLPISESPFSFDGFPCPPLYLIRSCCDVMYCFFVSCAYVFVRTVMLVVAVAPLPCHALCICGREGFGHLCLETREGDCPRFPTDSYFPLLQLYESKALVRLLGAVDYILTHLLLRSSLDRGLFLAM